MYEDGIEWQKFELEFSNQDFKRDKPSGFFASVEGAPPLGFRRRAEINDEEKKNEKTTETPVGVLTGELGAGYKALNCKFEQKRR